jgi:SHS2 domain-containing protein
MKQYQYEDHTAEAKFTAFGSTIEEAFTNAALALTNIIVETKNIKPAIKKEITIEAKQQKALLYDFLQEFIILFDSEFFALNKIETLTIKEEKEKWVLECVCYGDDAQEYETLSGVKAVTYNEMEIKEVKDLWNITVVLDV